MLSPIDVFTALAPAFVVSVLATPVPARAQQFEQGLLQRVLEGEPVALSLSGLAPGALVEVRAERSLQAPQTEQHSRAVFRADSAGRVDIGAQAPLSGSYSGIDASGLFWSMTPVLRYAAGPKANEFRFTAFVQSRQVAQTTVVQLDRNPDVVVEPVDAFAGAIVARPPKAGRYPTLIVLGGAEGDDSMARQIAPRLASEGYVVLGLPYYSPKFSASSQARFPGLPSRFIDIPVDRLERVWTWLKAYPYVDPRRIGLYGVSKGAEFSLIAASNYPWIKAVAAIVPSDVVRGGWGYGDATDGIAHSSFSLNGKPLPFTPYVGFRDELIKISKGIAPDFRTASDAGRWTHPERAVAARIPVERYSGPLLVVGGMSDAVWASGIAAQNIAETRAAAGLPTTALIFKDVGHGLSGNGWKPDFEGFGGSPPANARAQAQAWAATLRFLRQSLKPEQVLH